MDVRRRVEGTSRYLLSRVGGHDSRAGEIQCFRWLTEFGRSVNSPLTFSMGTVHR